MIFDNILLGFSTIMSIQGLSVCLAGAIISTIIGIMPGINAGTAVVLLLPFVKDLPLELSLSFILSIAYGCQYSGSTGAILAGIPGESSSAIAVINGKNLTEKGRMTEALLGTAIASFIGGMISLIFMILVINFMDGKPAITPVFYTVMILMALVMFVVFNRKQLNTTLIAIGIGFILTLFVAGTKERSGVFPIVFSGIDISVLAIVLFGVTEALSNLLYKVKPKHMDVSWVNSGYTTSILSFIPASIRGGMVGLINILPGIGYLTLTTTSYSLEKSLSHSHEFEDDINGLVGPEAANNSAAQCGTLSLLAFGMPTGAVTGLMATMITNHGVEVNSLLSSRHPEIVFSVIASIFIVNVFLLIINMPFVTIWKHLFNVDFKTLNYGILGVCFISLVTMTTIKGFFLATVISVFGLLIKQTKIPISIVFIGTVMGFLIEESVLKI